MILDALTPVVLAAGFRLRGDAAFQRWTGRGATTARLLAWAVPVGVCGWLLGLPPLWALALGAAAWAGSLLGWWGSLDLGRNEGTWLRDFAMHTLRGLCWTAPMAAVLFGAGAIWWWMAVAGSACGAAYEAGWRLRPPGDPRTPQATEIGEMLFGAAIGAAVVAAAGAW